MLRIDSTFPKFREACSGLIRPFLSLGKHAQNWFRVPRVRGSVLRIDSGFLKSEEACSELIQGSSSSRKVAQNWFDLSQVWGSMLRNDSAFPEEKIPQNDHLTANFLLTKHCTRTVRAFYRWEIGKRGSLFTDYHLAKANLKYGSVFQILRQEFSIFNSPIFNSLIRKGNLN